MSTIRHVLLLSLLLAVGGCANQSFREGIAAIAAGKRGEGIAALEKAAREEPRDAEIKSALLRNKGEAINSLLDEVERQRQAGRYDAVEAGYRRVLALDWRHTRALQGLEQLAIDRRHDALLMQAEQMLERSDPLGAERLVRTVRAQDPQNAMARRLQEAVDRLRESYSGKPVSPETKAALAKPVALEFRDAALKSVFEVLSRSSGLNFVFDKDIRGDLKVTLFVRNSPLEDILRLILATNQLEKRQLSDNSFLIYPNTPAKAREYQELVVRNFYLANADVKQALAVVKTVAKSKDVFADEKLNLLIVKDTPDAMRLIERLIDSLDLAEPEVMLEVEVLEVGRSRINELGVDWPDSVGYGLLQDTLTTTTATAAGYTTSVMPGGTLANGYVNLRNTGALTSFVANPALRLNLNGQNSDTNVLANPRIRVKNREKAKVHIGDKLPVFTTTATANVGVSASVNYLDVGLKLDVEPSVTLDDEVSIRIGLEVSSIVKEIVGPSNSLAYQVGTRSASTTLRLKNGETQVLAGLISDEERKATSHIPGIGEIPVLGRAFGSQKDTSSKTEIILLITPRIVRNIHRPAYARPALDSGTAAAVGAPPLGVRTLDGRSLSLSSRGGAAVAPAPAAPSAFVPALPADDAGAPPDGDSGAPPDGDSGAPPDGDDPPLDIGQRAAPAAPPTGR